MWSSVRISDGTLSWLRFVPQLFQINPGIVLRLDNNCFFPNPFQLIIHLTIRHYTLVVSILEASLNEPPRKCILPWNLLQTCRWLWRVLSSRIQYRLDRDVSEEYVDSKVFACCLLHAGFLLPFLFNNEDGGDMIPRNFPWLSTDYMDLYPSRQNSSCSLLEVFYGKTCTLRGTMFNAVLWMKSIHDWFTARGTLKAWLYTESNDLSEVRVLWLFLDWSICFSAPTRRNIYRQWDSRIHWCRDTCYKETMSCSLHYEG
jgi:hypothetical protein